MTVSSTAVTSWSSSALPLTRHTSYGAPPPLNPDTTYIQGEIAELEQRLLPMSRARPVCLASARPEWLMGLRLAEAWGSPRRALALRRESRLRSTSSDRSPVPSSFRPRLGLRPEGEVGPEFMAVALAEYMAAQNRQ